MVDDEKADGKKSKIETNEMLVISEHAPEEPRTMAERRDPM